MCNGSITLVHPFFVKIIRCPVCHADVPIVQWNAGTPPQGECCGKVHTLYFNSDLRGTRLVSRDRTEVE
jgi:hypothetical protein